MWGRILGLVPYGLGFAPDNCLVLLGFGGPDLKGAWRYDLEALPGGQMAAGILGRITANLRANGVSAVAAAGYGPARLVTPVADRLRLAASSAGLRVVEVTRVEGARYWSYIRDGPLEGLPVEAPAAGYAATLGPVFPSRAALAAAIAPVAGSAGAVMAAATARAEQQVARLAAAGPPDSPGARQAVASAGIAAVTRAIGIYRDGGMLSGTEEIAWLAVLLADEWVLDDACARMEPGYALAHRRLWADVTSWARPGYVAAPASLLAFTALQSGAGALANVAIGRALSDKPGFPMAKALRKRVVDGPPLYHAAPVMTPQQVDRTHRPHAGNPLPGQRPDLGGQSTEPEQQ